MNFPLRPNPVDSVGADCLAGLVAIAPGAGWVTPMKSPVWLRTCYDTLYPRDAAYLIETEGAVAPLARRGRLLPVLVLAGAEEMAETSEPPVADAMAARRLAEAILAERRTVRFGVAPADGLFTQAFLSAAQGRGIVFSVPTGGSPVLRLHDGWTDPPSQLSSRRRSDFRRMRRRAGELGPVAFEMLAPKPSEVARLLERAFAVEANGWKGRRRTAVNYNPAQTKFLHRYCTLVAAEGRCRIAFLNIGDKTAAMQIMVQENGALWLFKIGYDERFSRASPGTLLLAETIRQAATERLERVEFLGQAAPWTALWSEELRPNLKLRYYPVNPLGLATLVRDSAAVTARRAWNTWRQGG